MNLKRAFLPAIALLFACSSLLNAVGSPPELLSYQSYVVDANGVPLGQDLSGNAQPANYDMIFRIYSASTAGTLLWAEQQTVTIDNGYFSVLLGEGTVVGSEPRPPLSQVFRNTGADERFVGVAVRFEVGGEFTDILPRARLLSSPYSFLSTQALSLVNPTGQTLISADGSQVTLSGTLNATQGITAVSVTGNGANLNNLNASNLTTGTVAQARLPLLPASQINSGIFADDRLSANIVRLNTQQNHTAKKTFTGGIAMNSGTIQFLASNDGNHGLRYASSFGGLTMNGPVLYGHESGMLATNRFGTQVASLLWDNSQRVLIPGSLSFGSYSNGIRQLNEDFDFGFFSGTLRYVLFYASSTGASSGWTWRMDNNHMMSLGSTGNLSINGSLSQGSDRTKKENIVLLDPQSALARVAAMEISEWSYKNDNGTRHAGPMAQDFHAAFGYGMVNTQLSPGDVAGVNMAAIQALNATLTAQQGEITELRQTVADLQAAVQSLLNAAANAE